MKKWILGALLLVGALPARGATQLSRISADAVAISTCTFATPTVCTTGTHRLVTDDQVYISGVQITGFTNTANPVAPNGVGRCHVVTSTTCSLQRATVDAYGTLTWADLAGVGAYSAGGTMQPLGMTANGASLVMDTTRCTGYASIAVAVNGTINETVKIQNSPQYVPDSAERDGLGNFGKSAQWSAANTSQWSTITTLTAGSSPPLDDGSSGYGFWSIPPGSNAARVSLSSWVTGTLYVWGTCVRADGVRVF